MNAASRPIWTIPTVSWQRVPSPTAREVQQILAGSPDATAQLIPEYLPVAAAAGNTEAVRVMLDAGFDIETRGDYRGTALHHAAWQGHLETVRLLVERGASLDSRNGFNGTALDAAVYGSVHYRRDANWAAIVELLIAAGSDVTQVGPFPSGNAEVDAVLRRHGATPRGGTVR